MRPDVDALAASLPIAAILPELRQVVEARNVVIEAPPGAGKTSIVPLALLSQISDQILVLQPRRLAARLSALRCASLLGQPIGEEVGYRVRFDKAGGPRTRLWFMTEGVLLRRLRDDPELAGVGAVILDEFHERHLDGDLALALLRRLQRGREQNLRLLAMSATLDAEPVAAFLDAARLRAEGRSFPVEIEYPSPRGRSRQDDPPLERQVAAAVRELVERGLLGPGAHALVFLPGAREIQLCMDACASVAARADLERVALHGQLPRERQDLALAAGARGKLIFSTNVAETSITIDGVVAVIDSGLARVADFDPGSGLPRLSLAPISRASAAQRAGRAGRTRPGLCMRLYSRHDHDTRPEHQLPEIRRLELAGPVLELAAAGVSDPDAFPWFEAPNPAGLAVAQDLLRSLGAVDEGGALTTLGRRMLRFPLHPRLARLLVAGIDAGVSTQAARAAAILAERSLRRSGAPPPRTTDADILDELELLHEHGRRGDRRALDPSALAAVERAASQLVRISNKSESKSKGTSKSSSVRGREAEAALRQALLAAHPDRVAQIRVDDHDNRTLVFATGGSAELARDSGVRASPWVIALRSEERREGTRRRALVRSACAIEPEWLLDLFPDAIVDEERIWFDPQRERVLGESGLRYGKLVIESSAMTKLPEDRASAVLLDAAKAVGIARFCPSGKLDGPTALDQLRLRARFIHGHRPEFPELDDALLDAVLTDACAGKRSFAELRDAKLLAHLAAALGAAAHDHRALDRLAPTSLRLAKGRQVRVHYEPDRPPWIASRLQDFFGMRQGPKLLDGQVDVVVHLQAPNRHDVAVTSKLDAFWREQYPALRGRLSRRYPKHAWPEDPG